MALMRMNQAIARALADEMRADPNVVVMGEDVAAAGGVFKATEGLLEEFGPERVIDTPISEMGFLGAAVGAATAGLRPVAEIMFIEFLGVALDQLVTEAARIPFLSAGEVSVPMVVRASVGAGLGFGAQHSQVLEHWLIATPGLKVAMPSSPATAYALTRQAIRDEEPVVLLEPRALYGTRGEVDPTEVVTSDRRAMTLRSGGDATVVATGQMVRHALAAAEALAPGHEVEVIDPLWLSPWDEDTIGESVARTGRLAIVEESPVGASWGDVVAAHAASHWFGRLRSPVLRVCPPLLPIPFATSLEARWLPDPDRVATMIARWLAGETSPQGDWDVLEEDRS
jgi:pyruvate dehydrogenase E1 component beta subunit